MSESDILLEQILSGRSRQLQVLAASGLVPLEPEVLLPIQVGLTRSPDPEVAGHARQALSAIDPGVAVAFLEGPAGAAELRYFATRVPHPEVLRAVLQRRDVAPDLLRELAPVLDAELQEMLVLRQEAILADPQILVALESNSRLAAYTRRRIWEYREHLLPRDKVPLKKPEEIEAEADSLSAQDIQEAIDEVREQAGEGEVVDESKGLSEGHVRSLPVPVRMRLARNANRQLRTVLVRDQNVQVALTVLRSSQLSDQELERIANSRSVVSEVLAEIPKKREWIRKYNIVRALARNPKTLLPQAMRLVPRLTTADLRSMARDKNVSQAVRSQALRLYQKKR